MSDYSNILTKGLESSLDSTPIEDGKLRFTTDTRNLYMDLESSRVKISDIIDTYTEAQIFDILAPLAKVYLSSDTHRAYVSAGDEWIDLGSCDIKVVTSTDTDYPLLVYGEEQLPVYLEDVFYNPSYKELKVPNIKVTDSLNVNGMYINKTTDSDGNHIVEFTFDGSVDTKNYDMGDLDETSSDASNAVGDYDFDKLTQTT